VVEENPVQSQEVVRENQLQSKEVVEENPVQTKEVETDYVENSTDSSEIEMIPVSFIFALICVHFLIRFANHLRTWWV